VAAEGALIAVGADQHLCMYDTSGALLWVAAVPSEKSSAIHMRPPGLIARTWFWRRQSDTVEEAIRIHERKHDIG
jgi:hypothetical protein